MRDAALLSSFFLYVMLIEYKMARCRVAPFNFLTNALYHSPKKERKKAIKKGKVRTEAGVGYFIMCHIFLWSKTKANENL